MQKIRELIGWYNQLMVKYFGVFFIVTIASAIIFAYAILPDRKLEVFVVLLLQLAGLIIMKYKSSFEASIQVVKKAKKSNI